MTTGRQLLCEGDGRRVLGRHRLVGQVERTDARLPCGNRSLHDQITIVEFMGRKQTRRSLHPRMRGRGRRRLGLRVGPGRAVESS